MNTVNRPKFKALVDEAKTRVQEIALERVKQKIEANEDFFLIDVREESEYADNHLPNAIHLGKGVIERDIEATIPNTDADIILYCGGGSRSALACTNVQAMGYKNAKSMIGGFRGWCDAGLKLVK